MTGTDIRECTFELSGHYLCALIHFAMLYRNQFPNSCDEEVLYAFPGLDRQMYDLKSDKNEVLELSSLDPNETIEFIKSQSPALYIGGLSLFNTGIENNINLSPADV